MRVLLTTAPEVGHIAPLLGVAAAAREAGHHVAVATHPSRHALIREQGLEALPAGLSGDEVIAERLRRWPETRSLPATRWGVRMWVHIAAPAMARDVAGLVETWHPDVLVHEEGDYGGPVAAAGAGIPWVTHGWGAPLRPPDELEQLDIEVRAAGLWEGRGLAPPPLGGLYAHALIDPCPPLLDPDRAGIVPTWPVRPSILQARPPRPSTGPRTPRCYIGFGTVPTFANAIDDITAGAEAAASVGLDVVATTSDPLITESLTRLGVDVRRFVSLPDLLPECAVVVCHGGAGTTLAALSHGVPVIAVPQGAPSQERMGAAVERARVGRCVRTPSELPAAFTDVMGAELRSGAAGAATAIQALPPPSEIIDRLEGLTSP